MATDPQTLLTQAQCYACFGENPYSLNLMKLALLRQILLTKNASATVDPQGLLAIANCYACYAENTYTQRLMELALLSQITGP